MRGVRARFVVAFGPVTVVGLAAALAPVSRPAGRRRASLPGRFL